MDEVNLIKRLQQRISNLRGDAPLVLSGLTELGIRDNMTANQLGVTPPLVSQWRHQISSIPAHHHTKLVEFLRQAHAATLVEARTKPNGSAGLRAARAGMVLKVLEANQQEGE